MTRREEPTDSGESAPAASFRVVRTLRLGGGEPRWSDDAVAVEAPLAIELDDTVVATTLRTPGDDRALALGLLFAEGLLDPATLVSVEYVSAECDLVRVRTSAPPRGASSRLGLMTSACGACGRVGLEELVAGARPVRPGRAPSASSIRSAHADLSESQPCFARTGGVHAAVLVDSQGRRLASAEDVGRHNAVDKAVGRALEAGTLDDARLLVVSGRTSFEIVHKALAAGIPCVAGVSAPSSLAVTLAERTGLVLVGFVRGANMNVYANARALAPD